MGFLNHFRISLKNPNTLDYWDSLYAKEIAEGKIRQDDSLEKIVPILSAKNSILDFGSGPGGNVKVLASILSGKTFYLIDLSHKALQYAKNEFLGVKDDNGNEFYYYTDSSKLPCKVDAIVSLQVFEHLTDYKSTFESLWGLLNEYGVIILSVPVKGWRDSNKEHVNKFTVKTMIDFLWKYSEWITISPRTFSNRSGRLNTAYFYIEKNKS